VGSVLRGLSGAREGRDEQHRKHYKEDSKEAVGCDSGPGPG